MSVPIIRVWLSHDGYRDPDDNLAMLLGAAQARSIAKPSGGAVKVAGVVFGDTKDGGQYYMLNPEGTAPAAFGTDPRYGSVSGNQTAAGNYAFFKEYGLPALANLGPGWKNFDLLAKDRDGLRAWNFDATTKSQITAAAGALADDIIDAIALTGGAAEAAKLVVYSAGGGANVAGEAVGFLLNKGYSMADIAKHFAVVQHGNNWVTNYEDPARELTRDLTIAISNQNYGLYADGAHGPDLKNAIPWGGDPDGSRLGADFARALSVATGNESFVGLPPGAIFLGTRDASDAGSHAFATDVARLLDAWGNPLGTGEMRTGYDWAHLIDEGSGVRPRVMYDGFDAEDIARLLDGGVAASQEKAQLKAGIAASQDDFEGSGGTASDDLDLGAGPVGLRFTDLDLAATAEIASAYLLFEAERPSADGGSLQIELEDTLRAAGFAGGGFAGRDYLGEGVAWDDVGSWRAGETYRTPDLSALIERLIDGGGLEAEDALAFRISGSGVHSAFSFDSAGAAPQLVITYET